MQNWNNLQDCEEVALVSNFLLKSKLLLEDQRYDQFSLIQ